MPELPEVETVKERLKERLINKRIKEVDIRWDNIIAFPSRNQFIDEIKNQKVKDIRRRGKWLIIELEKHFLLISLRMEGKFFFKNSDEPLVKHEHIIFKLEDAIDLRYHDTRKFGKMHLVEKEKLNSSKPLKDLGLEPFDSDLTVKYLQSKLSRRSLPIKTVLLNQNIIAGIGNIYDDEILFLSKINPYKPANKLTNKELQNIINNTKEVLGKAIKAGGTTIRTYVSLDNKKGEFQHELYVYGRNNKPCLVCDSTIEKTTIRGRGTYYCPKCQR